MEELKNLDLQTLVDLLAKHTNDYMKMLREGTTEEEYATCKGMIENITAEIERKKGNTPVSPKLNHMISSDKK